MAGKKISELQALTEITGQEMIPVARDGQNYSVLTSLLQGGDATKLNDYMYDVSELMGKMAVRGTKGEDINTRPNGTGYYKIDGTFVELGGVSIYQTYKVEHGKIHHFDIGYYDYKSLVDAAFLVLFDENDKVLTAVPWAEGGFLDKYLVFTSEVKKYGITAMVSPIVKPYPPIYGETYDIQDINDVLSSMNTEIEASTASINSYKAEISEVLVRSTIRDGKSKNLKNLISGAVFDMGGELISKTGGYYQSIDTDLSKVYYLKVGAAKGDNSSLCLFDHNDKLIISTSEAVEGSFIFAGVAKMGISCNTQSDADSMVINSFDTQDLTTVLNTQQGNRALYVAAGAVYNEQTGFYELNGLTDITEAQMKVIYSDCCSNVRVASLQERYSYSQMRTNFRFSDNYGVWVGGFSVQNMCYRCTLLEVFAVSSDPNFLHVTNCSRMFLNCSKLKTIRGGIKFSNTITNYASMFSGCALLESIKCNGIVASISFSDSPLISLESLQYLIANAANTSAITVTVHADVYAKIQDETQTEWHALIAPAQEKNITFATA